MRIHRLLPALALLLVLASPALAHFGVVMPDANEITAEGNKTVNLQFLFWHPMEQNGMELAKPKAEVRCAGKKADLALGSVLFRQSLSLRLEHRPDSSGSFAHHMAQLEVVREFSTSATMSALSDLPFIALFIGAIWLMVHTCLPSGQT